MTETTKDAATPKKLTLWRKLGVVGGLVAFAIVAMVSIGLSNPRPDLRVTHEQISDHLQRGGQPVSFDDLTATLGPPVKDVVWAMDIGRYEMWISYSLETSRSHSLIVKVDQHGNINSPKFFTHNITFFQHLYERRFAYVRRWVWRITGK